MPSFALRFSTEAKAQLEELRANKALAKRLKSVLKAIAYLQTNPRHPGLQTHKYLDNKGPNDQDVFEAYAENRTPAAYRILWYYGPGLGFITILAIIPHP
jgi:hypothetical protein